MGSQKEGGTALIYGGVMQGLPMETYMMAFTYGSVVIFNASDAMTKRLLRMCRKYSKQVVQDEFVEGALFNTSTVIINTYYSDAIRLYLA